LIFLAGVAGRPQANNINECDSFEVAKNPAEIAANSRKCRTYEGFIGVIHTAGLGAPVGRMLIAAASC